MCVLAKVQLSPGEWEVPGLVHGQLWKEEAVCSANEVFQGAPNFVLDVFDSKDDEDFLRRRIVSANTVCTNNVVALNVESVTLLWHRLDGGRYGLVEPDGDGIIRSHALPDLWLPLKSVQERNWWSVLGCIERGVSRRANFQLMRSCTDADGHAEAKISRRDCHCFIIQPKRRDPQKESPG